MRSFLIVSACIAEGSHQEGRRTTMISEDRQTLLEVALWIASHRNRRSVIRQLAVTEANYVCLIRELDRVENQCSRARTLRAATTLTLVEWLETLEYFHWRCAYCQEKPFQVMSHYRSLPHGGTTADNCVPACRRCGQNQKHTNARVHNYLAQFTKQKR